MKNRNIGESFFHAYEGIVHTIKNERNMRVHILSGFLVIIASILFRLSFVEFAIVIFAIGLVITIEMANTMVERIIDMQFEGYNENAKIAKDVAAGAVLIATITAIAVGGCIFGGRIISWIMQI